jgi:hypothetical protein
MIDRQKRDRYCSYLSEQIDSGQSGARQGATLALPAVSADSQVKKEIDDPESILSLSSSIKTWPRCLFQLRFMDFTTVKW